MAALHAQNLELSFGDKKILDGASLLVNPGEILCIWGPSGEGKSTMLRVIAGLQKASSGKVSIFEEDAEMLYPSALDPVRSDMGFIFQNNALISNLRVFDNIALPLRYHKLDDEEGIKQRVESVLNLMLVSEYSQSYPHELSLGIQRRVAIARALVLEPKILLMDEPSAGLDFLSRLSLLALISNMNRLRKVTVICVTHDLNLPLELNAKVAVFTKGRVSEPVHINDIDKVKNPFLEELMIEMDVAKKRIQRLSQRAIS